MQPEYQSYLKHVGRAVAVTFCVVIAGFSAVAQQRGTAVGQLEFPIVRVVPLGGFGLGDHVQVEVEGTASEIQSYMVDRLRLILLFNGIPLRQMATNIIAVSDSTLSTNFVVKPGVEINTNVSAAGTTITHKPGF